MRRVDFDVLGEPKPKGSMRGFATRSGRVILTNSDRNTKEWQQRVATEAQRARPADWPLDGPVWVRAFFRMPRPKSLPRRVLHDVKRPDVDKLARAALDGLTGILFADDSQVVDLRAMKGYAEAGRAPGVRIIVERWED